VITDPRQQLRKWREALGLTVDEAAARFQTCKTGMLGAVERGERLPGRRLANEIKAVAGIPTEAWDTLEAEDDAPPGAAKTRGHLSRVARTATSINRERTSSPARTRKARKAG